MKFLTFSFKYKHVCCLFMRVVNCQVCLLRLASYSDCVYASCFRHHTLIEQNAISKTVAQNTTVNARNSIYGEPTSVGLILNTRYEASQLQQQLNFLRSQEGFMERKLSHKMSYLSICGCCSCCYHGRYTPRNSLLKPGT